MRREVSLLGRHYHRSCRTQDHQVTYVNKNGPKQHKVDVRDFFYDDHQQYHKTQTIYERNSELPSQPKMGVLAKLVLLNT